MKRQLWSPISIRKTYFFRITNLHKKMQSASTFSQFNFFLKVCNLMHTALSLTIQLNRHQSKLSSSKKLICKGTLRKVLICLRSTSIQGFCLGWSWYSYFLGSLLVKKSVKLMQNIVSNRTPYPPPPYTLFTKYTQ